MQFSAKLHDAACNFLQKLHDETCNFGHSGWNEAESWSERGAGADRRNRLWGGSEVYDKHTAKCMIFIQSARMGESRLAGSARND